MAGVVQSVARLVRRVADKLERTIKDISDDPQLQAALEADFGLAPGSLDKAKLVPPDLPGINEYILAADPSAEQVKVTFEAIKAYIEFWKALFDAAETENSEIVVDELLYRLFQTTTVDLIKYDYPLVYALMRFVGAIEQDTRLTLEEAFAPEIPANIFSGDYFELWAEQFEHTYLRFRLDQEPNLKPSDVPLNLSDRQLTLAVFALSDAGLIGVEILKKILGGLFPGTTTTQFYGWELPPRGTPISLSEHIASRTLTLAVSPDSGSSPAATFTQQLFSDSQGNLGWLLSFGGALELERIVGSDRPLKVTFTLETLAGLTLRVGGGSKLGLAGDPTAGFKLEIEPVESSTRAPALAIPQTSGSRLEIGDFTVKAEGSAQGFTLRAQALRSALVIVSGEGDAFVSETMPSETRIEFDLGLTIDDRGARFDGGGRLATSIAVNRSFGPVKVQTVELALLPGGTDGGSELRFNASASATVVLGPLTLTLEGIGATLGLGSTRGDPPPKALRMLASLLYIGDIGFQAPKGIGVAVDSDSVSGGGYLFFDPDNEQYAGALQLALGKRWTMTAIGLLTTRLPDGSKGFSLLVIASLEFAPPYPLGLGITLRGVGLLVGIHRTLDADALRAGIRNRTLDAILFPKDVVANAPRLVNSLKAVFPPARGHHLLGLTVSLGFGSSNVITAELGVIYAFGARRWAVVGQLHAEFPPTIKGKEVTKKKLLSLNIDAVGIWDLSRGEFSLDASLYDSHIAFVGISGDVAVRMRKGDSAFFLFSAGGYHPEFAVPPGFPQLQRLKISLADTKNLRLLTGYIAVTSNTRQIGARMEFFAGFGGFSIESTLSFDALFEADVRFVVLFDVEFKLKYKGITFFGVDVSGRFTGPHPKRVVGEWSIDLFFTSISKSFDKTFGEDRPPLALPAADPLPALVAALKDPANWSAELPNAARAMVTLRKRPGSTQPLVHPLGRLGVRQQVLPLSIAIDRFGGAPVTGRPRFDITQATVGGRPATATLKPVNEQFAAGDFLELSDDQKLARPSFETMPAGATMGVDALTFGVDAVVSEMTYDERIHGPDGPVPPPAQPPPPKPISGTLAIFAAAFGPAARSALRTTGSDRFAAAGPSLQVGPERYVVAQVADLAPTEIVAAASFTAARQALERHVAANPAARGDLQVVAES